MLCELVKARARDFSIKFEEPTREAQAVRLAPDYTVDWPLLLLGWEVHLPVGNFAHTACNFSLPQTDGLGYQRRIWITDIYLNYRGRQGRHREKGA